MKFLRHVLSPKITIVTIVFKKELPLLMLQAKSIKMFANVNLKSVIIVINDFFSKQEAKELGKSYNQIFEGKVKVEIILGAELIRENYLFDISGWKAQQILKLKVHQKIETAYYLSLDAKNHLIRELQTKDLFSRRKPIAYIKENSAPYWIQQINSSKKVLDISNDENLDYFIPPATPYILITEEVKNLSIFLASKNTSTDIAISERGATEYLLYYLYLGRYNRAKTMYCFKKVGDKNAVTFFNKAPRSNQGMTKSLQSLHSHNTKWLAVHRNRFVLDYEVDIKKNIIEIWVSSGLFESAKSAENFWSNFKRSLGNP